MLVLLTLEGKTCTSEKQVPGGGLQGSFATQRKRLLSSHTPQPFYVSAIHTVVSLTSM